MFLDCLCMVGFIVVCDLLVLLCWFVIVLDYCVIDLIVYKLRISMLFTISSG